MNTRDLTARFAQADDSARDSAIKKLRIEAQRLANAETVTDAELRAIDEILKVANLPRARFAEMLADVMRIEQLKADIERQPESRLRAAYEASSQTVDRLNSELGKFVPTGFESDRTRREMVEQRDAASRERSEAESMLRTLKVKREQLRQLEATTAV